MTNREILKSPDGTLSSIDRQKKFTLQIEGRPMPCSVCDERTNVFDAANINIDAYDFGASKLDFHCPSCGAELDQIVPFIAIGNSWHWQVKQPWLQEQMRKAKAFDEQRQSNESPSPDA